MTIYRHVDDFIDDYDNTADVYARWVLFLLRLPAADKESYRAYIEEFPLFCTYEGARWRCTGASSMGDMWLHSNRARSPFDASPYEERVSINKCSEWSRGY